VQPRPSPGRRWWTAALALASTAAALQFLVVLAYRHRVVWWKTWEHSVHVRWSWLQFIHPPLFNEYMAGMQRWSAAAAWPIDDLLNLLHVVLTFPLVLIVLRATRDGAPGRWWAVAGALMLLSPSGLRPFEQYPPATLILTATLALLAAWFVRGGAALGLAAGAATLLTVEFHLSSWFAVGPLLVMGAVALPERRRGIARIGAVVLTLFFVSTQPGVFRNSLMDVLVQDNVQNHSLFALRDFGKLTFELSNPLLYAPLLLWLLPDVRAREPRGAVMAVGLAGFVAAHLLLQGYGFALASTADEPHRYFAMIDPFVAVTSVWAVAATWEARPDWRPLLRGGLVLLGVSQGLLLSRTLFVVWSRAH